MTEQGLYEHECQVYYGDFDSYGHLKLSALLQYLSDIAGLAYASLGYTRDWLLEHGQVFLLSQFRISLDNMPQQDESFRVVTWESGTKGPLFIRNFRMVLADGRVMGQASSTWILVHPDSRKILRPKDLAGEQYLVQLESAPPLPEKLHDVSEEVWSHPCAVHTVRYADMDKNQHVYNAKYADILYDALPEKYCRQSVKEVQILYKKEATLDSLIKIAYQDIEGGLLAVGKLSNDEISFAAKLIFTAL